MSGSPISVSWGVERVDEPVPRLGTGVASPGGSIPGHPGLSNALTIRGHVEDVWRPPIKLPICMSLPLSLLLLLLLLLMTTAVADAGACPPLPTCADADADACADADAMAVADIITVCTDAVTVAGIITVCASACYS